MSITEEQAAALNAILEPLRAQGWDRWCWVWQKPDGGDDLWQVQLGKGGYDVSAIGIGATMEDAARQAVQEALAKEGMLT